MKDKLCPLCNKNVLEEGKDLCWMCAAEQREQMYVDAYEVKQQLTNQNVIRLFYRIANGARNESNDYLWDYFNDKKLSLMLEAGKYPKDSPEDKEHMAAFATMSIIASLQAQVGQLLLVVQELHAQINAHKD